MYESEVPLRKGPGRPSRAQKKRQEKHEDAPPEPIKWELPGKPKEMLERQFLGLGNETFCDFCKERCKGAGAWIGTVTGTILCSSACIARERRRVLLAQVKKVCQWCSKRILTKKAGFVLNQDGLWHEECLEESKRKERAKAARRLARKNNG